MASSKTWRSAVWAPSPWLLGAAVGALAYIALSLFLTRHGAPLAPDAMEYAAVARNMIHGAGYTVDLVEIHPGLLPVIRHLHELHGLLQPVVLSPLFWVFGPDGSLVRVPGIICVGALSVVTFAFARHYFDDATGCIAAGFVVARKDLGFDAILGGDDVGWALFSTAALLFFAKGVETRRTQWWVLAGLAAAFATLQKFSGILLPGIFAMNVLLAFRRTPGLRLKDWLSLVVPVAAAAALYGFRNHALHGGLGFRYSPLDWLSKENYPAYFAYYPTPPTLSGVLSNMGPGKVLGFVLEQFRSFGSTALGDWQVLIGGPVALLWLFKGNRGFAALGLSYAIANILFVCVVYHVESRYLFGIHPIYFVALAAASVGLVRHAAARMGGRLGSLLPRISACLAGIGIAVGVFGVLHMQRDIGDVGRAPTPCADAVDYIRKMVPRDEGILASNPWFVAWSTERPTINVPTNGTDALLTVARHYKAQWAVDGLPTFGGADLTTQLLTMASPGSPMRVERVYDGVQCDVYHLDWEGQSSVRALSRGTSAVR